MPGRNISLSTLYSLLSLLLTTPYSLLTTAHSLILCPLYNNFIPQPLSEQLLTQDPPQEENGHDCLVVFWTSFPQWLLDVQGTPQEMRRKASCLRYLQPEASSLWRIRFTSEMEPQGPGETPRIQFVGTFVLPGHANHTLDLG